jgi:hypothetical protein
MKKITAIQVGPADSYIVRDGKLANGQRAEGKKQLQLANGSITSFSIPKWSDPKNHTHFADFNSLLDFNAPLGIHTGLSGIIVLDFDTDELFNRFLAIDASLKPEEQCRLIVRSDKKGGHFYYIYEENELTKFIGGPNGKKLNALDTLYGNTLVFAPVHNYTKLIQKQDLPLNKMPLAIQMAAIAHYASNENAIKKPEETLDIKYITSLAPLIEKALLNDIRALDNLLVILTPPEYKSIMIAEKYRNYRESKDFAPAVKYHPDKIPPEESAHMYLVALSGALMLDESVSPELHTRFMEFINSMFSQPLPKSRLMSIINHDIKSPHYRYNPVWTKKTLTLTTLNGELIEIFMFHNNGQINYLVYNHITQEVTPFSTASAAIDFIQAETGMSIKKDKLTKSVKFVNIIHRPDKPFGYNPDTRVFNSYRQTIEQQIFYNPQRWWDTQPKDIQLQPYTDSHPLYPKVTLAALKSSIGGKLNIFLSFMARKFKTHDYSPLFFVFYGVPHSFKSAVVNGVFAPLAYQRYKHLSLDVMTDKYNDWMVDTDLVLIDEVHHLMSVERTKLIKTVNEVTGNSEIVGVRRMFSSVDTKVYPNELTFILTTNATVKLTTETRDRRMVVFKSMQKVADALGMSNIAIEKAIKAESKAFAYYLSTQVEPLYGDAYITNELWKDEVYEEFQEHSLNLEDKLAKLIDEGKWDELLSLFEEMGLTEEQLKISIYNRRGPRLRLFNTKEENASVPGLLYHVTDIDINKLKKKLQLTRYIKYNVIDSVNGRVLANRYIDVEISNAVYEKYTIGSLDYNEDSSE